MMIVTITRPRVRALVVVLLSYCVLLRTHAFVPKPQHPPTMLLTTSLSRIRALSKTDASTTSISSETSTTTASDEKHRAEADVSSLHQESFLSDMEASLDDLVQQQEALLDTVRGMSSTNAEKASSRTKQAQIDRQYQPFRQLARQAAALETKYAQEIRVIRTSSSSPRVVEGLTQPTQALAWLGGMLTVGTTLLVVDVPGATEALSGFEPMWKNLQTTLAGLSASTIQPVVNTITSTTTAVLPLEVSTSVTPETTLSSSYALKDFASFDVYASASQVNDWFSGK